jgi:CRISPR-associated protein Cmr1
MPVYDFKLRLVSPAFVAGTDKERPEMRASTIRGHWRYWWRAFNGVYYPTAEKLYEQESKVFGSTSEGSRFNLIVIGNRKIETHELLPHREGGSGNVSKAQALGEGSYSLRITTRPGQNIDDSVWDAFMVWSLLGGMGRRSRRMFGAVNVQAEQSIASAWYPKPDNPQHLAQILKSIFKPIKDKSTPNVPTFPTFSEKHSWVIVSTIGFETAKEANQEFFRKLLRTPKYRTSDQTFGSVQGGRRGSVQGDRRGSPVHAQVRKIGTEYYPVISAFWSKPDGKMNTNLLSDFMKEAQNFYQAEHVWGGW